ncbi:hypothetical protein NFI96_000172, partial [Prochilodus magdalenae]
MEELKKKNEEELNNLKSSFDKQVENLKSSVENLNSSVENLKNQNNEELKDLKTSFNITETQVESLKRENQERKVVFSASLSGGEEGHTGPYSAYFPLVYKHVFTNIGNAYNPATEPDAGEQEAAVNLVPTTEEDNFNVVFAVSVLVSVAQWVTPLPRVPSLHVGDWVSNPALGIFTAPVRGVYQFRFHVYGHGGRGVDAILHKNGRHIAGAFAVQNQQVVNSSNGVSLLME